MVRRLIEIATIALLPGIAGAQAHEAQRTGSVSPPTVESVRGPFARIAIMRAIDGHAVDWEEGYIRHLDWHKQAGQRDTGDAALTPH